MTDLTHTHTHMHWPMSGVMRGGGGGGGGLPIRGSSGLLVWSHYNAFPMTGLYHSSEWTLTV